MPLFHQVQSGDDDGESMTQEILAKTRTDDFRKLLADLLFELCRIDTPPNSDVDVMRRAESECFDVLERELTSLWFPGAYPIIELGLANESHLREPSYQF